MADEKSTLVYSTDREISRKEKPSEKTVQTRKAPEEQRLRVRLDRKARGGKSVTVIEGLRMGEAEKEALLKQLKTKLGTGGTLRDAVLEIQGDHRDMIMAVLEKMGLRPKRSGG